MVLVTIVYYASSDGFGIFWNGVSPIFGGVLVKASVWLEYVRNRLLLYTLLIQQTVVCGI